MDGLSKKINKHCDRAINGQEVIMDLIKMLRIHDRKAGEGQLGEEICPVCQWLWKNV